MVIKLFKNYKNYSKLNRNVIVTFNASGFYETGIYSDIIQHAAFFIVACSHARFHWSLRVFEDERINYKFKVCTF